MPDKQPPPWWRRRPQIRRVLAVVGVASLLVGFVWLWWQGVPALYRDTPEVSPADQLKATTDTRTALVAGLAALGAVGTFWLNGRAQRFTAQTLRISEENLELAKRSQEQSFELAERGHVTDRFSKAIEQLGGGKLDVRLGGIYALEQLATDSEQTRDQATIVEVLSAFVRVHSDPLYQYTASLPETAALAEPIDEQRRKAAEYVVELDRPAVDVQAAVTVLGRLPIRPGVQRADLRGANLRRADLREADLSGANFRGANLSRADLRKADLTRADLGRADLTEASLDGAKLAEADLAQAKLIRAVLVKTDLTRARLAWAKLDGARLRLAEGMAQDQLDLAAGDSETKVPSALKLPQSWTSEDPDRRA